MKDLIALAVEAYNQVTLPQFLAIMFLLSVCVFGGAL